MSKSNPETKSDLAKSKKAEDQVESKAADNETFGFPAPKKIDYIKPEDLDARLAEVAKIVEDLKTECLPYSFFSAPKGDNPLDKYSNKQINSILNVLGNRNTYSISAYLGSLPISEKNKIHCPSVLGNAFSYAGFENISKLMAFFTSSKKIWKMLDTMDESDARLEKITDVLIGNFLGVPEHERFSDDFGERYANSDETSDDREFNKFIDGLVKIASLSEIYSTSYKNHLAKSITYSVPLSVAMTRPNPFFALGCVLVQSEILRNQTYAHNNAVSAKNSTSNVWGGYDNYLKSISKGQQEKTDDEIINVEILNSSHATNDAYSQICRVLSDIRRMIVRELSVGKRCFAHLEVAFDNLLNLVNSHAYQACGKYQAYVAAFDRAGISVSEVIEFSLSNRSEIAITQNVKNSTDYDPPF